MKNVLKNHQYLLVLVVLGITVIAAAWQTDNKKKQSTNEYATGDTTQPKQHDNDKDEPGVTGMDDAMKELDIQMQLLNQQLKNLHVEISKEVTDAISKIDMEKINKEIAEEIEKIDIDKIKIEVDNSLKEAQEQIKKIDMDKIKMQMEDIKQQFNNGEFKKQIEDAMQGAKRSIEKAKQQLKEMKDFTDELEKDGLINKKKGCSIEWKNGGELYINGKKQPKEISDKYKKYYKKDNWKIQMNGENGSGEFL